MPNHRRAVDVFNRIGPVFERFTAQIVFAVFLQHSWAAVARSIFTISVHGMIEYLLSQAAKLYWNLIFRQAQHTQLSKKLVSNQRYFVVVK